MEFRNLEDVHKVLDQILWDLTPQKVVIKTRQSLDSPENYRKAFDEMRGYYFCVNVWGCKANLALVDHVADIGSTYILETDIPDAILEEAVFDQGGSMLIGGLYAIDDKIKSLIFEYFNRIG
jgi:hypothetical protein